MRSFNRVKMATRSSEQVNRPVVASSSKPEQAASVKSALPEGFMESLALPVKPRLDGSSKDKSVSKKKPVQPSPKRDEFDDGQDSDFDALPDVES